MSGSYLQTELRRLDLLIHREILRLRAAYQLSLDEFRGLYVSDQQVDTLLREHPSSPEAADPDELTQMADAEHRTSQADPDPRWSALSREFGLGPSELDVLLLALALDVHPKYETLYAYLNNDVTRKWPTCDLALRLFATSSAERSALREALLPHSRLV